MKATTNNQLLELIAASTNSSLVVSDDSGKIIWTNKAFEKLTGYSTSEVLGKSPGELLRGPETDTKITGEIDDAIANGSSYQSELASYRKDGSWHWIKLEINPLTLDNGKQGHFSIFQDITTLKETEHALQEHLKRLQIIINNNPDSVYLTTPDLELIAVNKAFVDGMQGLCSGTIEAGKNIRDLLKGEEAEKVVYELTEQLQLTIAVGDRQVFEVEHYLYGRYGAYQRCMNPVYEDGEVKYVSVHTRDLTQAKVASKEIDDSRKMYKTLTDNSKEMIALHELDGTYLYLSPSVEEQIGFTAEEMLGKNSFDYLHPDDHKPLQEQLATLAKGGAPPTFSYRLLTKSGEYIWAESTATLIKDEQGKPMHIRSSTVDITARKALKDNLVFQSNVLDNLRDGIIATDLEGNIIYWNDGAESLFGFEAAEVMGKTLSKIEKAIRVTDLINGYKQSKDESIERNWGYNRPDGIRIWVNMRIHPLYDDEEKVVGLLGIARDITEKRRINKLMNLTNTMSKVGGWEIAANGEEIYVTKGIYEIHGLEADSHFSLEEGMEYYHPDDREKVKAQLAAAITTGESFDFEARLIDANGIEKWVRARGLSDMKGDKVVSTYGTLQDITGRKLRELKLAESEARFRKLTETAPIGIYLADKGTNCIWVNRELEKLGECSFEDFAGRGFLQFVHPEDLDKVIANYQKRIEKGYSKPQQYRFITKTGKQRVIESVSAPIFDDKGELTYMVGSLTDVTDKLEYQNRLSRMNEELEAKVKDRTRELEESNQELETFNFMMTHDLKTPLRSASIFTQMLQKDKEGLNEGQLEHLQNISKSLQEAHNIIKDLLEFARLRKGKLQKQLFSLRPLISAYFSDFKTTYRLKAASIEIGEIPKLALDPTLFDHVLSNLIGNAFKYRATGKPLKLTVSASQEDDKVWLRFQDNGMGFDQKYAAQMFEPFKRLVSRQHSGGSGLGLAICKRIIERHNGSIWAESHPGKGATFIISLPI